MYKKKLAMDSSNNQDGNDRRWILSLILLFLIYASKNSSVNNKLFFYQIYQCYLTDVVETTENDDPLAGTSDDAVVQNGIFLKITLIFPLIKIKFKPLGSKKSPSKKRKGRKSNIMKVGKVKVAKKMKKAENAPEPDGEGEYEVQSIVDHKKEKGRTIYRIRWKGYSSKDDTWLPATELSCKDILKKYRKKIERENKDVYTVSFQKFLLQ